MCRAIILVVDGFGLGAADDADVFGDVGSNTFAHLSQALLKSTGDKINLPTLSSLGLLKAATSASTQTIPVNSININVKGAYGYCQEISSGKDTPSGHWEMMGVPVLFEWGYFHQKEHSFPADLISSIKEKTRIDGMLGNCHASGTEILKRLGQQHLDTGWPICYTSADSVFQIAAHEEHFGLDNLYRYCEQVRELLTPLNIGRVIARPFVGDNEQGFTRTGNRRDYSILPPAPTLLEKLKSNKGNVVSIGKIADIYAHQGISKSYKATGISALMQQTMKCVDSEPDNSLIFTNLVNFDQDYGHRRDPIGYARALESFDSELKQLMDILKEDDVLFITSDHGCDPTWQGTEHTREFVPLLAYHKNIDNVNLGKRTSFADLGKTLADLFLLEPLKYGESFLRDLNLAN